MSWSQKILQYLNQTLGGLIIVIVGILLATFVIVKLAVALFMLEWSAK